jgi:hypothetical protein
VAKACGAKARGGRFGVGDRPSFSGAAESRRDDGLLYRSQALAYVYFEEDPPLVDGEVVTGDEPGASPSTSQT